MIRNIGISDYNGTTIKGYPEQKEIKTRRIYINDSFVEVNFSVLIQEKLMNTLKCINKKVL